jgi:hypothetical protein
MSFFRGARSGSRAGGGRRDAFLITDPDLPGQLAAVFAGAPGSRRRRPVTVDTLTLADVTGYFASERPEGPDVKAAALLSAAHPSGRQVFQVFLDEADRVCADASGTPYGRRIITRRLDDELLGYLGGGDLLIFR